MAATDLKVFPEKDALAWAAADWFVAQLRANPGRIAVCLTGGSTPEGLYRQLAARPLPWERLHLFWSDERYVAATDPLSNTRMGRRALIDHVPIPAENVHPIPTATSGPDESAALYEEELQRYYGAAQLDPATPLFDVVINGMGGDGHTASLFPGAPALAESERWAVATEAGMEPFVPRVSLTFPVLNSSRAALVLVSGAGKRSRLQEALSGADLPVARLEPQGELAWFADRDAAPV